MAVSVDDVKKVLYLDGKDDDGLIQGYIDAADQSVRSAVGDNDDFFERKDVQPLFDVAVKSLAAGFYQYRLPLSDTQTYPIDMTVNSIIGQLRGKYDVEVGDDDATTDQSTSSSH